MSFPRKPKRGPALWVKTYPEQATPNRAVLEGRRKARYERKSRTFKRKHPVCEARLECCTKWTDHVHHINGRNKDRLLDDTKWKAVCAACHRFIHDHPDEARKLNLLAKPGNWNRLTK